MVEGVPVLVSAQFGSYCFGRIMKKQQASASFVILYKNDMIRRYHFLDEAQIGWKLALLGSSPDEIRNHPVPDVPGLSRQASSGILVR